MKKNKILIVYSGARFYGGIETYLENLFKYKSKNKPEIILLSIGEWELTKIAKEHKVKTYILPEKRIRPENIKEIVEIAINKKIQLIVSSGVVANFYARQSAKKGKLKHLTIVHSDIDFDYPDSLKRVLFRFSDKLLRSYTDHFIAVSEHLRLKLIAQGIPAEKITVIYNGVSDIGAKEKKREKKLIIGSIGRLHYTKGFHNLIEAFKYLPENVTLNIWGEGDERVALEELAKKLRVDDRVNLAGFGEIEDIFKATDIYIQPSLSEGFGLTVAEAMLAKKPIIVTPAGSLPELIEDGKTGLVAGDATPETLAASIKALIENEKLAKTLSSEARKDALKRFSLTEWAKATIKTFSDVSK